MTPELIAAASAVVVALISAAVAISTSSDHRKQALEEAELLKSLKESVGTEAPAFLDLQTILATRMSLWRRWRLFLRARMLLQLSVVVGAVSWTAFVTRRTITEDVRTAMEDALEVLGDTAFVVFVILVLSAGATALSKVGKFRALTRAAKDDVPAPMTSEQPSPDE